MHVLGFSIVVRCASSFYMVFLSGSMVVLWFFLVFSTSSCRISFWAAKNPGQRGPSTDVPFSPRSKVCEAPPRGAENYDVIVLFFFLLLFRWSPVYHAGQGKNRILTKACGKKMTSCFYHVFFSFFAGLPYIQEVTYGQLLTRNLFFKSKLTNSSAQARGPRLRNFKNMDVLICSYLLSLLLFDVFS